MSKEKRNQEIYKEYKESGKSMNAIAKERGISTTTVYNALHSIEGFEAKTNSDYRKYNYKEIYIFISNFFYENYRSPSLREISNEFNIPYGATIVNIMENLAKEGKLIESGEKREARRFIPAWAANAITEAYNDKFFPV